MSARASRRRRHQIADSSPRGLTTVDQPGEVCGPGPPVKPLHTPAGAGGAGALVVRGVVDVVVGATDVELEVLLDATVLVPPEFSRHSSPPAMTTAMATATATATVRITHWVLSRLGGGEARGGVGSPQDASLESGCPTR
jgi:hypothetical protein